MCSCSIRILHLTHPINFKPLILSCYLPGEKLRELLHEEGSMEMVNLRIDRSIFKNLKKTYRVGGTRRVPWNSFLVGMCTWTEYSQNIDWLILNCFFSYIIIYHPLRTMVGNAIKWAKANGCCRVNPVHGAEEYRVSTFEAFSHKEINRTRSTASAEVELQDN